MPWLHIRYAVGLAETDKRPSASFYASGFEGGHAHGALHGTFEGRALGKEKAFELWEEVGYYAGIAQFWLAVLGERER